MKKILLILTVIALASCGTPEEQLQRKIEIRKITQNIIQKDFDNAFTVIDEDGCEYWVFEKNYIGFMSHKGMCSNPKHSE